jgi:hypothetical protein
MIVMRRLSAAVEFGYPRENCRASSAGLMREPYKARSPRKSFDGVAMLTQALDQSRLLTRITAIG